MKVALLLSGQPRFLTSSSYESIKKDLLRLYDVDVFCHTWFAENATYSTAPWSGLGCLKIAGDVPKIIETLYSPKVLKFDPPLNPQDFENLDYYNVTSHPSTPYNLSSMYLSMKKCYEGYRDYCESNNVKYDWVIRLRYDGYIENLPNLNTLQKGQIYVSNYHHSRAAAANNGLIISANLAGNVLTVFDRMKEIYDFNGYLNDEQIMAALYVKDKLPVIFLPREKFDIGIIRYN